MINLNKLICNNCPAIIIRNKYFNHFSCCEKIRDQQIFAMDGIKLFLLGESIPADIFIYDLTSDYSKKGLRFHLKNELKIFDDQKVLEFLRYNGILICDCALCPLHKLGYLKNDLIKRNLAATICLKNNTRKILEKHRLVPIVTFFSEGRGFDESCFVDLQNRIIKKLSFNLKNLSNTLLEIGIMLTTKFN